MYSFTLFVLKACLNSCHAEKQIADCGCAGGQFPSDAEICNLRDKTTGKYDEND